MIEALGWVGSALIVCSLMQRDVRRLRWIGLAAAVVLVVFNAIIGIASMVALNIVLVAVNAFHLARPRPDAGRSGGEEVVHVRQELRPRGL
ncbi:hypothetical protein [Agromyces sp. SYSU T00194]|uniref:hypothetical protein n=1 Tax=Agromyces chitinivorans TaxID=3158560 RepID=UPI00339585EA